MPGKSKYDYIDKKNNREKIWHGFICLLQDYLKSVGQLD